MWHYVSRTGGIVRLKRRPSGNLGEVTWSVETMDNGSLEIWENSNEQDL